MTDQSTERTHDKLSPRPGEPAPVPVLVGQQQGEEPLVRGILDAVHGAIFHISEDGNIIYANKHARQMPGLAERNLIGMPLRDFVPHTVYADNQPCSYDDYPAIKCLRTGQPQPPQVIGLRVSDGQTLWVTASAVPFRHPITGRPDGVIATVIDITQRRTAEDQFVQSEERYRRLVEEAPDAIIVHQGGTIVFINDAGVRLWGGTSQSQFIGRRVLEFVHPRNRNSVLQRMGQAMSGATMPLVEHSNVRLDGRVVRVEVKAIPCLYDGSPAVQVIIRDVTQRRRMERKARKQREILKKFFNRIPALVGFFTPDGRLSVINQEWKRILGSEKDLTISILLDRCRLDPAERRDIEEHLERGHLGWRDFRVPVRDGRILDMLWASVRLSDGTRIGIGQDVTPRKQAEEALRRNQAELEARVTARTEELSRKNNELENEIVERWRAEQQLQEKQRFLERLLNTHERDRQLVAYEIHDTFLQGVIGALMFVDAFHEQSAGGRQADASQLEMAQGLLRKSITEARRMISGLRPPIIDEQGIVAAVEYLINEMNATGLEIEFSHSIAFERLAPLVEAAMFRIVQEGLTNFQRHSQSTRAAVSIRQSDEQVCLEIRDWGVGFDPALAGEGHFGLQGVRERARLVGGSVAIDTAIGKGTRLAVTIPVSVT
jgi:PAS domain S-box-containing protein